MEEKVRYEHLPDAERRHLEDQICKRLVWHLPVGGWISSLVWLVGMLSSRLATLMVDKESSVWLYYSALLFTGACGAGLTILVFVRPWLRREVEKLKSDGAALPQS